jgi:hypothetical protein
MKTVFTTLLILLTSLGVWAQNVQTIRGQVTDAQSNYPLVGAVIVVVNSNPLQGTTTDENGNFRLEKVPQGRQAIKISMLGYEERVIPNILLTSGKELTLNIGLQERLVSSADVVITAKESKRELINNEFVAVSASTLNMEETSRYAGSRNDPGRMAANFAGVVSNNDSRNDIIIRGNSPAGVLWRMEGADIPNPNHFGALGATGGPVSMLNYNVLDQSDFLTGAFPAGYGNTYAGVFDLKMRKGNSDKREYMGQIGFNGFEAGLEGPFKKGGRSSYLINYRYSTLAAFQAVGFNLGTGSAVPYYQDLSFKMNFELSKNASLSWYGIGGFSKINFLGKDADTTSFYSGARQNLDYRTRMGTTGLVFKQFFNERTYQRIVLSASANTAIAKNDSIGLETNGSGKVDYNNLIPFYRDNSQTNRFSARYFLNHKLNVRTTLSGGVFVDRLGYSFQDSVWRTEGARTYWQPLKKEEGSTFLYQAFVQGQYVATERLTFNAGLHSTYLALNQSASFVEPRAGAIYKLTENSSLNAGYGIHSQMQPLSAYFYETRDGKGGTFRTNTDLGLTKAHHFVLGYKRSLGSNLRLKAETYYQSLSNVPVETKSSSTSLLNDGADFNYVDKDSLVNNGTGRNYGVELTLERFFTKGYYFLFSNSLYQSEYQGSDKVWRNTAFNGNYVTNLLAGKEWKFGEKNTIALDIKLTAAGGRRLTPIDLQASAAKGEAVYMDDKAFSDVSKAYFRTDFKITYRRNGKRLMQEWYLDLQNLFNNRNVFSQTYDAQKNRVGTTYQLGLFPLVQYRVTFN